MHLKFVVVDFNRFNSKIFVPQKKSDNGHNKNNKFRNRYPFIR